VAETVLPPTLRLTILRRVSFLPETTLQALRSASILGSGFSLTDLATVTGRPAVDLSVVLGEAIRAGVLDDDGARLRFRHDLIRDAIYKDLAGSVRRALHREAGQRLAHAGAPALQVAEHLARGATPGDPEAVPWLARAARQAAPRSPDVAADLLDRAVLLMAPGDPGRDGLLAERASSLMWAGRIADAEATCRMLLGRDHDRSVEGAVRVCLGHALLAGGRAREGLNELERACQSSLLTGAERAEALAWASLARLVLADLDGAAAAAAQARPVAVAARDHLATSVAVVSLAQVSELRGDLGDALQIIDDAVRLADDSPASLGHRFPVHDCQCDAERRHRLPYSVEFRDDDQDRQALAAAHGFVRNVHASQVHLQRQLDALPPLPAVPDGFAIRTLADAAVWRRTNPMIIAHTLINSVAFIGFALFAGARVVALLAPALSVNADPSRQSSGLAVACCPVAVQRHIPDPRPEQ